MSEQSSGNWFYGQGGAQNGPVDLATLREMAASGRLQPGDLVWRDGMPDWVPATSVPEIYGGINAGGPNAGGMNAGAGDIAGGPIPMGYYTPVQTVVYAGFWWRVLAVIIDGILIAIVLFPLQLLLGMVLPTPATPSPTAPPSAADLQPFLVATVVNLILQHGLQALYYGLMESSRHQATIGKLACGLSVTDLNGNRISFGRAIGRYFASILSALILFIGYIMGAFTERKQCLHDMIVGTLVLKGRPRA